VLPCAPSMAPSPRRIRGPGLAVATLLAWGMVTLAAK